MILTCSQVFRTLPPPLHLLHLILPSWFPPSPHLLFANLHTLQPQNLLQCNGCIGLLCHRLGKTMLHSTALPRTTLHCTALHCTALHCMALNCSALHKTELHCTEHHCTGLNCTALHCTALNPIQCTLHASVTQCPPTASKNSPICSTLLPIKINMRQQLLLCKWDRSKVMQSLD